MGAESVPVVWGLLVLLGLVWFVSQDSGGPPDLGFTGGRNSRFRCSLRRNPAPIAARGAVLTESPRYERGGVAGTRGARPGFAPQRATA